MTHNPYHVTPRSNEMNVKIYQLGDLWVMSCKSPCIYCSANSLAEVCEKFPIAVRMHFSELELMAQENAQRRAIIKAVT